MQIKAEKVYVIFRAGVLACNGVGLGGMAGSACRGWWGEMALYAASFVLSGAYLLLNRRGAA